MLAYIKNPFQPISGNKRNTSDMTSDDGYDTSVFKKLVRAASRYSLSPSPSFVGYEIKDSQKGDSDLSLSDVFNVSTPKHLLELLEDMPTPTGTPLQPDNADLPNLLCESSMTDLMNSLDEAYNPPHSYSHNYKYKVDISIDIPTAPTAPTALEIQVSPETPITPLTNTSESTISNLSDTAVADATTAGALYKKGKPDVIQHNIRREGIDLFSERFTVGFERVKTYKVHDIIERYSFVSVPIVGVFGRVSRAISTKSGDIVAIKEFIQEYIDNNGQKWILPLSQQAILREAHILSRLDHPNVGKMIELVTATRLVSVFLVMPLYKTTLRNEIWCSKSGIKDNARTKGLVYDIAAGLEYIHSNSVIHRDLKPENIMLNCQDEAILIDFGIAADYTLMAPGDTKLSVNAVSANYRAPELALGDCYYDYAVDIWAFACILYEIHHRQVLFYLQEDNNAMLLDLHLYRLGKIDEQAWPEVRGLPFYESTLVKQVYANKDYDYLYNRKILRPYMPTIGPIFDKMVAYNPKMRPTSRAVLDYMDQQGFKKCK